MDIVYLLENHRTGKKYIGSKKSWKGHGTYFGSPSCSPSHPKFQDQQDWLKDSQEIPESFSLQILEQFEKISQKELVLLEKQWQIHFNAIKSKDFINAGYAGSSSWYGGYSFKNKSYEEIYGERAEDEKEKRKEKGISER